MILRHEFSRVCRAAVAVWLALALAAPALPQQAPPTAADVPVEWQALYQKIATTPVQQMDVDFFKLIYQTYDDVPEKFKSLLGRAEAEIPKKNARIGELRKFFDWSIQAEWARDNNAIIENTNQGKDNGGRSDLDATANVLDLETGKIRDAKVKELVKYHESRYGDAQISTAKVDVSLFNGDAWLPDFRDSRLSYAEYTHKLVTRVYEIRSQAGAYYVPGAHKEQAHDRALAEGHTIHLGWDFVNNMPAVNGLPFMFDAETGRVVQLEVDPTTGKLLEPRRKLPLVEYTTSEAAKRGVVKRYEGISELHGPDKWRRSFGNLVQNLNEFSTHSEPLSRNKYFIERILDQAINRVANVNGTYVEIHNSGHPAVQEAWKRVFIEKAFGVTDPARVSEIQSVLDRSAQIQIDYKAQANYSAKVGEYYGPEIREVRGELLREGMLDHFSDDAILKKAQALFAEKQRTLALDGGMRVIEKSFAMEFTPEGVRRARHHEFGNPEVAKKIMFERGLELSLFFDTIEMNPTLDAAQKAALRERVIQSIPAEARPTALKVAELAKLKIDLVGRSKLFGKMAIYVPGENLSFHETLLEVHRDMRRVVGEIDPPTDSRRAQVQKTISDVISRTLGPVYAAEFRAATEVSGRALARQAGQHYWNEFTNQFDGLMMTMGALAMTNVYQQQCAGQISWNENCLSALGNEAVIQALFTLPYINSLLIFKGGAEALAAGDYVHGTIGIGLGVGSIPAVASGMGVTAGAFIQTYIAYMVVQLAVTVTYGYAVQRLESDFEQQAFRAIPSPGRSAYPYEYPGRGFLGVKPGNPTPVIPLLADLTEVEADGWSVQDRTRKAREMFRAEIEAEVRKHDLHPLTKPGIEKGYEIAYRYGSLLPYLQRMAKIYDLFRDRAERTRFGVTPDTYPVWHCVDNKYERIEKEFAQPPSLWERNRLWGSRERDKAIALAQAEADCTAETIMRDDPALRPIFEAYVDDWFALQRRYPTGAGYVDDWGGAKYRKMLTDALIREYVTHRNLASPGERERQMKIAAQKAAEVNELRRELLASLLGHLEKENDNLQQRFEDSLDLDAAHEKVPTELELRAMPFPVRLGEEAVLDFSVRGEVDRIQPGGAPGWLSRVSSEVVAVRPGRPEGLLMTPALEAELEPKDDGPTKRFVTIEEKLTGELRDEAGTVLATDEATQIYYELRDWQGRIIVDVSAPAGVESDPEASSPYMGAKVELSGSGASDAERAEVTARTIFSGLPAGKFTVSVTPRQEDDFLEPTQIEVELIDFTSALGEKIDPEDTNLKLLTVARPAEGGKGDAQQARVTWKDQALVTWKDEETVEVILTGEEIADTTEDRQTELGEDEEEEGSDELAESAEAAQAAAEAAAAVAEAAATAGEAAAAAGGQALADCQAATGQAEAAERIATEVDASLTPIAARSETLGARVDGLAQLADQARAAAALADARAQSIARTRDLAATLRDEVCSKASAVVAATTQIQRDQLLREVEAAQRRLAALPGRAEELLQTIRTAVAEARSASQQAQTLLNELAAAEAALAELATPLERARAALAEAAAAVATARGQTEQAEQQAQGASALLADTAAAGGQAAGTPEAAAELARLQAQRQRIESLRQAAAACQATADKQLTVARQAVTALETAAAALGARIAQIRQALEAGGYAATIDAARRDAEATLAVAEAFMDTIRNRAEAGAGCTATARSSRLAPPAESDGGSWGDSLEKARRERSSSGEPQSGGAAPGGAETGGSQQPTGDIEDLLRAAISSYSRCSYAAAASYLDQAKARSPGDARVDRMRALVAQQARAEATYRQAVAQRSEALAQMAVQDAGAPELSPPCQIAKAKDLVNRLRAGRVIEDALAERERQQREWDRWGDEFAGTMIGILGDYNRAQRGDTSTAPVPPTVPPSGGSGGGSGGGTASRDTCHVFVDGPSPGNDVFFVVWDGDETGELYTVWSLAHITESGKQRSNCTSTRNCFEGYLKQQNPRMRIVSEHSTKAEAARAANARCGR